MNKRDALEYASIGLIYASVFASLYYGFAKPLANIYTDAYVHAFTFHNELK